MKPVMIEVRMDKWRSALDDAATRMPALDAAEMETAIAELARITAHGHEYIREQFRQIAAHNNRTAALAMIALWRKGLPLPYASVCAGLRDAGRPGLRPAVIIRPDTIRRCAEGVRR